MYEIVFDVSPSNQNPGAAPVYSMYIYSIFMLSLVPPPQFLYVADPMCTSTLIINTNTISKILCYLPLIFCMQFPPLPPVHAALHAPAAHYGGGIPYAPAQ